MIKNIIFNLSGVVGGEKNDIFDGLVNSLEKRGFSVYFYPTNSSSLVDYFAKLKRLKLANHKNTIVVADSIKDDKYIKSCDCFGLVLKEGAANDKKELDNVERVLDSLNDILKNWKE